MHYGSEHKFWLLKSNIFVWINWREFVIESYLKHWAEIDKELNTISPKFEGSFFKGLFKMLNFFKFLSSPKVSGKI